MSDIEIKCVNTIRCISAALPEKAKSGHPGAPMGCAAITHVLYTKIMRFYPEDPTWIARDRFILSNGHSCALLYTMLHLSGYDLSIADLQEFRQVYSKTPGHPERLCAPGVEVTTGPLGQGVAQAVGLAIGGTFLSGRYNQSDSTDNKAETQACQPSLSTLFHPYIYVLVGDGCLQEGVSSEVCSLAGHLGLGNLIVLYDRNYISIDGSTDLSFTENVEQRFLSYNWEVLHVKDGTNNIQEIEDAVILAKQNAKQPTLIICNTVIGYGCSKEGTEDVHGSPIGLEDLISCRKKFKLDQPDNIFHISRDVYNFYRQHCVQKNRDYYDAWTKIYFNEYKKLYPDLYTELNTYSDPGYFQKWIKDNISFDQLSKSMFGSYICTVEEKYKIKKQEQSNNCASSLIMGESTRALSGQILNIIANTFPTVIGGSADLTKSNCTVLKNIKPFTKTNSTGRYIHFGVREHGMAAIMNGIQCFGLFRGFAATFLNFITYAWGAVRLSSLSNLPVLYIMTHDSIELGEDGPTHQPIEVASLCRSTPNMYYFRPSDPYEVLGGYLLWLQSEAAPVVLSLSRSGTPYLENTSTEKCVKYGGYITIDFDDQSVSLPKLILSGSGTELALCYKVYHLLKSCINIRIVSLPCWEIFNTQSHVYRYQSIFPQDVPRIYVEAAHILQYHQYFDDCIQMTCFGASGPKDCLLERYGFTSKNLIQKIYGVFTSEKYNKIFINEDQKRQIISKLQHLSVSI